MLWFWRSKINHCLVQRLYYKLLNMNLNELELINEKEDVRTKKTPDPLIFREVTIIEASRILGISTDTIRRWEKKKLIRAKRSEKNYRLFSIEELKRIQDKYLGLAEGVEFQVFKSQSTNFKAIELFSGCGGMALGFANAGLKTGLLVEIDPKLCSYPQQ